jgi:diadenosine tetraphosphate (Ap4A) HIT family hydrolase
MTCCSLCSLVPARIWIEMPEAIAFAYEIPVADGHMIVAPRAHVATVYQLNPGEQHALWKLVDDVRNRLTTGLLPPGVWVGMTSCIEEPGPERHEHVHVVPGLPGIAPAISGLEWSYVGSGEYASR